MFAPMGDTQVSVADRERPPKARGTVATQGFLSSIFPRFEAPVSPEFYRLSGKLRAISNLFFLIANFALAPQVEKLGFDVNVLWKTLIGFTVMHLTDGGLGVWLWRGKLAARAMRHVTYVCVAIECCGVVTASWVYGSVNSPFIAMALLFILIYRLAFDFRVGVAVFVAMLSGLWVVVGLEVAGVIPPQPMAAHAVDGVYALPAREIGGMVNNTLVIVLTFATASWAVGRLRHKDLAIRMLRESLYAADRGKVGRHTGRTLSDTYTLGVLLGVGGMGEVYEGTHLRTQRKVAVKMLHAHLVTDHSVLARFRREAEITAKLGSEHIVSIIDVDDDDEPFLVLELVEGESLAAQLKARGALPLAEVADIIDQIARGLDIAHGAGIVHRDLKPENIFLCPRPPHGVLVKILDFGVSKIQSSATAITHEIAILGTPDYMSPEQARGRADEVQATSDVFALAGIAYKCLTGHRPFQAESIPALLAQICEHDPEPVATLRPDAPAAVAEVIAVAMAKRPSDRHPRASDFARELRAALTGVPAAPEVAAQPAAGRRKKPDTVDVMGKTMPGQAEK
jgi:tRNA A-37 threonylcarbamoyl transferase component Bud32